ncbi:hypothetical protein WA026_011093 [Henosepilachna vigintioctopunctata]|uniref:C3H1-type domain-containing protein n=1 Tax=Henosepilachna vigintioctopunctata TaxID=420089 RepID=A0AAW1U5Q6_9CUCU
MALVCDNKSEDTKGEPAQEYVEDLEDGEIEDDDEAAEEEPSQVVETLLANPQNTPVIPINKLQEELGKVSPERVDRDRPTDRPKEKKDRRHKDKDQRHMTEAEKSILHLRRKERMEREKWNKFRKDHQVVETQDDFAINLEKTLASILKKDRVASDEDKEEDRRSSKRKKRGRDNQHKAKLRKTDSPKSEEMDEKEILNIRGGSPETRPDKDERLRSPRSEQSYDSEYSSDQGKLEEKVNKGKRENKRENRKSNKNKNKNRDRNFKRDRSRDRKNEPLADSKGICIFYLNGKCNKNDCIYSHEAIPPMKLELYFPCKFYHMGIPCNMGENCKFAHGKPLSDGLKQILFKHIETAPRDILGGFPRLSREETLNMMDLTQKNLLGMYQESKKDDKSEKSDDLSADGSIPSLFDIDVPMPVELRDESCDPKVKNLERARNRPSRWQEPDPPEKLTNLGMSFGPFNFSQDQDMRINSNGDIDMRTLPPHPLTSLPQPLPSSLPLSTEISQIDASQHQNLSSDVDIRNLTPNLVNFASDVDIRLQSTFEVNAISRMQSDQDQRFLGSKDVDIRQLPPLVQSKSEDKTEIHLNKLNNIVPALTIPSNLPKMQRELFMRIQSQQRENPAQEEMREVEEDRDVQETNWYSDDDDDDDENRLTIKVDNEDFVKDKDDEIEEKEEVENTIVLPTIVPSFQPMAAIKPSEVVEKIGDLSKINITADITKLLSTLSGTLPAISPILPNKEEKTTKDPRQSTKVAQVQTLLPSSSPCQSPPHGTVKSTKGVTDPRLSLDPRRNTEVSTRDPVAELSRDPRRGGTTISCSKTEKMSIYEQGGMDMEDMDLRIDMSEEYKGSSRSDVDLRTLGIPFKGMQNYTPATEIDASCSSHPPLAWKVSIVDIPRPDYSGLKLSINDAEKTGDPRLRKIFRLSIEEKDTPTSPKASPRSTTTVVRIDPRLRKAEEPKGSTQNSSTDSIMNYTQQLNTLQSSGFYQSLTSNQKLMLNQELSSRTDQTNSHDPILNGILANLNLIPQVTAVSNNSTTPHQNKGPNVGGIALSILQSINKMNPLGQNGLMGNPNVNPHMMNPGPPMLNQINQGVMQPGLLGAAPGIPNMPQEFPMSFDPRGQNGLLGNGPGQYPNFDPPANVGPPGGFHNYQNDDFYPQDNNQGCFRGGNQGRNDRGGGNFNGRDRRRGGRNNNFGRNAGNRNQFRRNQGGRSNRPHTPP